MYPVDAKRVLGSVSSVSPSLGRMTEVILLPVPMNSIGFPVAEVTDVTASTLEATTPRSR